MGRPFVTGGINFTPEADRQLNELDDWITKRASADVAQRFVSAILDHIETIPAAHTVTAVAKAQSPIIDPVSASSTRRRPGLRNTEPIEPRRSSRAVRMPAANPRLSTTPSPSASASADPNVVMAET